MREIDRYEKSRGKQTNDRRGMLKDLNGKRTIEKQVRDEASFFYRHKRVYIHSFGMGLCEEMLSARYKSLGVYCRHPDRAVVVVGVVERSVIQISRREASFPLMTRAPGERPWTGQHEGLGLFAVPTLCSFLIRDHLHCGRHFSRAHLYVL